MKRRKKHFENKTKERKPTDSPFSRLFSHARALLVPRDRAAARTEAVLERRRVLLVSEGATEHFLSSKKEQHRLLFFSCPRRSKTSSRPRLKTHKNKNKNSSLLQIIVFVSQADHDGRVLDARGPAGAALVAGEAATGAAAAGGGRGGGGNGKQVRSEEFFSLSLSLFVPCLSVSDLSICTCFFIFM